MNEDEKLVPGEIPIADPADGQPKEFLISESDLGVPAELMGVVGDNLPTGYEPGLDPVPDVPASAPAIEGTDQSEELRPIDEDPNPSIAVDEMLSAALAEETSTAIFESSEVAYSGLDSASTFQVVFRPMDMAARSALKKLVEAQGITLTEKSWLASSPVVSQLTEFQAIALLQAARSFGVAASGGVHRSEGLAPSEEDLALGDLANVPDTTSLSAEGAPGIVLPRGESDVFLCTPDAIPSLVVQEMKGLVTAHRSIPRRLFREEEVRKQMEKELRTVPGKNASVLPNSLLQLVLRDLFQDLRKAALVLGANAALGIKLEAFSETSHVDPQLEQLRLVAIGTAAVVEKT